MLRSEIPGIKTDIPPINWPKNECEQIAIKVEIEKNLLCFVRKDKPDSILHGFHWDAEQEEYPNQALSILPPVSRLRYGFAFGYRCAKCNPCSGICGKESMVVIFTKSEAVNKMKENDPYNNPRCNKLIERNGILKHGEIIVCNSTFIDIIDDGNIHQYSLVGPNGETWQEWQKYLYEKYRDETETDKTLKKKIRELIREVRHMLPTLSLVLRLFALAFGLWFALYVLPRVLCI